MPLKRSMYEETPYFNLRRKTRQSNTKFIISNKRNKNSNTSQSPTNTIAKNTTHMGVRHMVSTKTWDDLKPHKTTHNHLQPPQKFQQPPQKHLLPLANYLTSYKK